MANKDNSDSPSNLWARRSNSSKPGLATTRNDSHDSPSIKRGLSSSGKGAFASFSNISTSAVSSPTGTGASSAFGLGSGAFASFGGGGKTPKTPGATFDSTKVASSSRQDSGDEAKETARRSGPAARKSLGTIRTPAEAQSTAGSGTKEAVSGHPTKYAWVVYYRPPTSKNSDYEKSIRPMYRMDTVEIFWQVYAHLKRPSQLPQVSDYHFFREGIRPVWEDDENKEGGKFTMRLKKGVADRYWESLLMAMVGDQFAEASDEVCGAVVSTRQGEDVISIWTKNNGGRNVKIRETIKRVLNLPADTHLLFRSHDDSMQSRVEVDKARAEKTERRNTLSVNKDKSEA
ncbi:Putative translation Initiation factor eIF- 4e [Septoria linicola]|uniref:Translation Initiation factor eIF- 4e n=1 Tax=Septoria linicola TaxID=215465 RepID=A0A9Q9EIM6_9PEZI|nr:putative translation Initiation factor eIF- 4e [Septoria linicola]USW51197.1 Putative translation Initiation factor eIF- 4e [Septoria linicola]